MFLLGALMSPLSTETVLALERRLVGHESRSSLAAKMHRHSYRTIFPDIRFDERFFNRNI